MASFFAAAARRATAYSYSTGMAALPVLAGTTSFAVWKTRTECEAFNKKGKTSNLKTRMTSIGRFSLESQTAENPSVPTFFLALSGDTPMTIPEFSRLWKERDMENRHPRFHSRVSEDHPGHFEPIDDPVEKHCSETVFPLVYRTDLMHRIQTFLLKEIQVWQALWQLQLSHGPFGKSGAISKAKSDQILKQHPNFQESLLLFRFHHALADGVSIMAALSDLCDEAEEFRGLIMAEIEKRRALRQSLTFLEKLARTLKMLVWLCWGSMRAMLYQSYLYWTTPCCPFDEIKLRLNGEVPIGRSVSWCDAAPIDQVKSVAKSMGKKVTINDVIVSCVSYAVAKQLEEHERLHAERTDTEQKAVSEFVNVAIPVHLGGGVLLPGESIGNKIGAFVARVPGAMNSKSTANDRLAQVHDILYDIKRTPAPLLSHWFAKFCSTCLSPTMTQRLFSSANAGASFVVSNAGRGPPKKMHLGGRAVESATGFLPLPPGIPIGIVAGSYAGTLSLSVTAEQWAVPDADKFLRWVLEEYQRLYDEAQDQM